MNNALLLAQLNYKSKEGQRNLLNKWFQDSVKNYIFEQIAAPLIANFLKCSSQVEVKAFIHKNIDKSKPKYMSIIDQYFFYINKYNQRDLFIQRLNAVLLDPLDISQNQPQLSFTVEKTIRKQLVCYLILHFFLSYGQIQVPSFYELWNLCFPEEIQKKKRLTKFDKKNNPLSQKDVFKNESSINSFTGLSNINQFAYNQEESQKVSSIFLGQSIICQFDSQQIDCQSQQSENLVIPTQKKQINNGIIAEDDFEEDFSDVEIIKYSQKSSSIQSSTPIEEPYYQQNFKSQCQYEQKTVETFSYYFSQQSQNQFIYSDLYIQLPFDKFQLNQYQFISNEINYQINSDFYNSH